MSPQQKIDDSRVIESRVTADGMAIRRRREAPDGRRYTTYERLERPHMVVIKKDGKRELFDRDKLKVAINKAVGKFFASDIEIEIIVNNVEDALYGLGETEVSSRQIGDLVMDQLAQFNEVAYVRFASVYREFKTLDEFEEILQQQRHKKGKAS